MKRKIAIHLLLLKKSIRLFFDTFSKIWQLNVRVFTELHCEFQSNACKHIDSGSALFASPQCVGYRGEKGKLSLEMCYPSDNTIVKQVKRAVKEKEINNVFIATDSRDLISKMKKAMPKVMQMLNISNLHCVPTTNTVQRLLKNTDQKNYYLLGNWK